MVIFAQEEIIMGGSEVLLARLALKFIQMDLTVTICTRVISEEMRAMLMSSKITIIEDKRWVEKAIEIYEENDRIITFQNVAFLSIQFMMKKTKFCDVYLYVVHPHDLFLALRNRKIYKLMFYRDYKNMVLSYYNNGNIIFMDDICANTVENFYKIKLENKNENILLLPIELQEFNVENFKNKVITRKEEFRLLSIARADFPFKGYLKGLIEEYGEMKKEYPFLSLKIVSTGEGFQKLQSWCDIDSSITLVNGLSPVQLKDEYEKAHLYFGMGTTLLEASVVGTPSITMKTYTYDCSAKCFFYEDPKHICEDISDTVFHTARYFLEKTLNMTDDEYTKICELSRKAVEENYDINLFCKKILSRKMKQRCDYIFLTYGIQRLMTKTYALIKKRKGEDVKCR